ncbi:hypothetical protein ALC57_12404 [Trachymyrmex cornetzi]|uniref:Uncharacterized protein n=1 Tax=Trachymyrmex cornetzi TaxID=471704 RepID=A0A195DR16_9HYME|nr:hypothetical protein ALC57_12404 [Trachymyrmex cornetzi]
MVARNNHPEDKALCDRKLAPLLSSEKPNCRSKYFALHSIMPISRRLSEFCGPYWKLPMSGLIHGRSLMLRNSCECHRGLFLWVGCAAIYLAQFVAETSPFLEAYGETSDQDLLASSGELKATTAK